ncbi:uncharacterized protein VTP21DRAFT_4167 [Calcarisporiella thermophila]|uniref:uncharacterized protein n=1 Tax=Calcarisporiella thermophila TaxID=911321 RepID=UPI0037446572
MPFQYFRFIRPPPRQIAPNQRFKLIYSLTNDLGDESYSPPFDPRFSLIDSCTHAEIEGACRLVKKLEKGTPGENIVEVAISNTLSIGIRVKIRIDIGKEISGGLSQFVGSQNGQVVVIPVLSADISVVRANAPVSNTLVLQAERHFYLPDNRCAIVSEETGHSIARRIWDCGVMLAWIFTDKTFVKQLGVDASTRFLELGAGCGPVSIVAASILSAHFTLTDVEEAIPLLHQNCTQNSLKADVVELDWGQLNDEVVGRVGGVDVILLADVLYNESSHGILLDTLCWFSRHINPRIKIVLAYKFRHESELNFFDMLKPHFSRKKLRQEMDICVYLLEPIPI